MKSSLVLLVAALVVACGAATTTPPTAQPGAGVPDSAMPIPHEIVGREDCTSCHGVGSSKAPPMPTSHQGRANASCTGCHHPKAG